MGADAYPSGTAGKIPQILCVHGRTFSLFNFMSMVLCLRTCVYNQCMAGFQGDQKRVLDPVGLEPPCGVISAASHGEFHRVLSIGDAQ